MEEIFDVCRKIGMMETRACQKNRLPILTMAFPIKKILFGSTGILIMLAAAGVAIFEMATPARPAQDYFVVLRGENILRIAANLKSEGYIKSKTLFIVQAAVEGDARKLKSGKYDLKGLDQGKIIDKIAKAQTVPVEITVIPGWSALDIAYNLEAKKIVSKNNFLNIILAQDEGAADPARLALVGDYDFLADLPENASLDGYLYPDTYQIPSKPVVEDVARLMLDNFGQKLAPDLRAEISRQGKSIFEIITMASMLEEEVKTMEDKKLVSGILWKRASVGMPLQVDSTLLYFLAGDGRTINKNSDSPYNTYRYGGLPAGPICNPGLESIEAAIYPTDSSYWYYLSKNDGTTVFSRTYPEHVANKNKYLGN